MTQICLSRARRILPFVTPILMLVQSTKGGEIVWRRKATLSCAKTRRSKHEQDTQRQPLSVLQHRLRPIGRRALPAHAA